MDWDKLTEHLTPYQRKIIPICGDGKCFLTAVRTCLANDYLIEIPEEEVDTSIVNEIYNNLGQYTKFQDRDQQADYTWCWEILPEAKTYVWMWYYGCHCLHWCQCLRNQFCHLSKYWRKSSHHLHQLFQSCNKQDNLPEVWLKSRTQWE